MHSACSISNCWMAEASGLSCDKNAAAGIGSESVETKMTYMEKGRNMQKATEMTTSTHHSVQVRVSAHGPQAGTQTKAVILTIVASPYIEGQRCKCKTKTQEFPSY